MRVQAKPFGLPIAIAALSMVAAGVPAPIAAQTTAASPTTVVQVGIGRGRMVTLSAPMSDLFVANDQIADVQVRSPTQLYVFGKAAGETTVYATTKAGRVVYSAQVRVGNNYDSVQAMLQLAMPDARIVATPMNGLVLLTGVVANPDDAAEAERLVQAFVGDTTKVITRLRAATPLQVNLQVRVAEVSRSFMKNIGVNLMTRDTTGGFQFGVASGRTVGSIGSVDTSSMPQLDASSRFGLPAGSITLPFDVRQGDFVYPNSGTKFDFGSLKGAANTSLGLAGKLFGLDILSAIDLGERLNQVTTLANPNLTALSGETATFLAGGEIPIPIAQGLGVVTVEYKQYGVSLAYTPTVLADGRISLRVRPEVSQLSSVGATTIGGTPIPGVTTRRVETTVELGSGQSFVLAGLLSNTHDNTIDKAPGLGDLPILGSLFRSNGFQRNETELVIVITPFLVKPVDASQIALPTDGYMAPTDLERVFLGKMESSKRGGGGERPKPTMAQPSEVSPALGALTPVAPAPAAPLPAPMRDRQPEPAATLPSKPTKKNSGKGAAAPGFSFN